MSNSIWKTPDIKPEENKLIFAQHDHRRDGNIDYFIWDIHEFIDAIRKGSIRWCYLDELLAQADKAERLEKENEEMREEFEVWHGNHKCVLEDNERLQKAVDLAVLRLEQGKKKFGKSTMGPNKETAMLCEIVIDEIKQLIKGE